ncbi:MAG: hydrolase 2, exosortase A system-associated [Pseudomonadales bacterium]|nr:hydrolase 2, exosortase A system-associated [Pseudomonadales bacterium]
MDSIRPFYIEGTRGKLFAIYHQPPTEAYLGAILFAPPFAEEMNKSRPMVARQARAFAKAGFAVLLVDYYGTGDSEGEFSEASLDIWSDDFDICLNWLARKQSASLYVWGLRFGCLLAAEVCQKWQDQLKGLIFWEPVLDGNEIVSDFDRLERLGKIFGAARQLKPESEPPFKGMETREIGGYEISCQLLECIKKLKMDSFTIKNLTLYRILGKSGDVEGTNNEDELYSRDMGSNILRLQVHDKRFWLTQEITIAEQLLEITTSKLVAQFTAADIQ